MNLKLGLISLASVIALIACASTKKNGAQVTFQNVKEIATPSSDEEMVKVTLGNPGMVTRLSSGEVAWIYLNDSGKSSRASIVFKKNSKSVAEVNWLDEDDMNTISSLPQIFNGAEFKQKQFESNTHSVSSENLLVDAQRGISVLYQQSSGKISSISWDLQKADRNPAKDR